MCTIITAQNLTQVTSTLKKFAPINDKDHQIEKSGSLISEQRETLIIYGNPKDPEVAKRINKAFIQGRKIEVQARPSFDTGLGKCGNHLCHCKTHCMEKYANQ